MSCALLRPGRKPCSQRVSTPFPSECRGAKRHHLAFRPAASFTIFFQPSQRIRREVNPPQRLGAFLVACRAVEPYQQQANDRTNQYLQQKVEVPGWSLVTRSQGKYVEAATLQPLVDRLGAARVLEEYGHLSEAKYQKLCAEAGIKPDSAAMKQGAGAIYLRSPPELTTERK